jgi:UDP-3-O-[3-hydroxymyristoyl] glucosamine N-acyltransferase
MADPRFFRAAGPYSVSDIASLTGSTLGGASDAALSLRDVAPLDSAGSDDLSFLSNRRYIEQFGASKAGAVFVVPALAKYAPASVTLLLTANPYLAYALAARHFYPEAIAEPSVAPSAVVDPTVVLGENVAIAHNVVIESGAIIGSGSRIEANSVIGPGVVIGKDCRIGANVTISHCLMGDRVTAFPGARIGQDGFGFAPNPPVYTRIPQLGRVIIGDDVEIGANTTIDRGAGPDTIIGAGTMIDNLVQIAHNVQLGRGCIIVAQSGVAGSSKLGDFVTVGGNAAISGHLTVGDGARVAGGSGVMRDIPARATVGGLPSVSLVQWLRQTAILDRLAKRKEK